MDLGVREALAPDAQEARVEAPIALAPHDARRTVAELIEARVDRAQRRERGMARREGDVLHETMNRDAVGERAVGEQQAASCAVAELLGVRERHARCETRERIDTPHEELAQERCATHADAPR